MVAAGSSSFTRGALLTRSIERRTVGRLVELPVLNARRGKKSDDTEAFLIPADGSAAGLRLIRRAVLEMVGP